VLSRQSAFQAYGGRFGSLEGDVILGVLVAGTLLALRLAVAG
jgi:hypothetical protein